jgi:hypothetical protein
LNPLNVEINELETSNKLSLALSRIVWLYYNFAYTIVSQ